MAEATFVGSLAGNFKDYGPICINSNVSLRGGRSVVKNGQNFVHVVIE